MDSPPLAYVEVIEHPNSHEFFFTILYFLVTSSDHSLDQSFIAGCSQWLVQRPFFYSFLQY